MASRSTTVRRLLFLLPLLCHDAAAYVPCTVMHRSGSVAEPSSMVIGSAEVPKGSGSEAELSSMVIGSAEVPKGTTPWMVSIQTTQYSSRMHVCGGVIVDPQWILTSAHCVQGEDLDYLWIVAGDHNLTDCDGDETFRKVNEKVIHHLYDSFTRVNNIALLHLNHKIWRTSKTEPIVILQDPGSYTQETCKIFGWGATSLDGSMPDVLMGANQTVFAEEDCRAIFSSLISDDMLCAADLRTGAGPCQGDWGGPLVCRDKELCGIASWGAGCGSTTLPAVFTNVTYFYDWVDNIVHFHNPHND